MIRKLQNKSGASIILALVFMLICTVIGGIVLTAATDSAGQVKNNIDEEQEYQSLYSAATLVSEAFINGAYSMDISTPDVPVINCKTTAALQPLLKNQNLLKNLYITKSGVSEENFTIELPDVMQIHPVTVRAKMSADYSLHFYFTEQGKSQYKLNLALTPSVNANKISWQTATIGKGH